MELKNFTSTVTYRIEEKPEGGFIARSSDPSVSSLEAPTREELQKKINEKIFGDLAGNFGMPGEFQTKTQTKLNIQIKKTTPGGTTTEVIENPSAEQLREFAKGFSGRMIKDFPQLAEAIANASQEASCGALPAEGSSAISNANVTAVPNDPIMPERSSGNLLRLLIFVVIGAALTYFFLHHR